jgi:hypothetical protein
LFPGNPQLFFLALQCFALIVADFGEQLLNLSVLVHNPESS